MEQLADDAVGLADHLGIARFVVLGHSYGGFVAQELALRHPDRVDALVLVDTTPGQLGADEAPGDDQGPPPPPELLALMGSVPSTDEEMAAMMPQLLPFYFHRTEVSEVQALMEGTVHRADVMVRGFEVLSTWSSYDRLPGITAPTLLLAGRHDVFTSFPQSHRIARRLPDAEVVVFDRSGHFPWIEEPERFFETVLGWLGRRLGA
jgi:proline iminopeptidase